MTTERTPQARTEIAELIAVGLLSQKDGLGLTAVQAHEIGARVAATLRPNNALLRSVAREIDEQASIAHDFVWGTKDRTKADADAAIWRIHELLRPLLKEAGR